MGITTKYLPVEGEIKGGDKILWPNGNIQTAIKDKDGKIILPFDLATLPKEETTKSYGKKKPKLLKLHAVTQDIKVGDKVFGNDKCYPEDEGWGEFKDCTITEKREKTFILSTNKKNGADGLVSFETNQENCYKILGEISPHAIWVKDGLKIKVKPKVKKVDIEIRQCKRNFEWSINSRNGDALCFNMNEELRNTDICQKCPYNTLTFLQEMIEEIVYYKVKCPTCGNYH